MNNSANSSSILNLLATISQLRHPTDGCPWDLAQNHESLIPYLFEESYEFKEAVKELPKSSLPTDHSTISNLKNELGDILLQVLLHSQLAHEKKWFHFLDVCEHLNTKMIHRHPHVFQKINKLSKEEVEKQWKEIKNNESSTINKSLIPNKIILKNPLEAAHDLGDISQKHGFDWNNSKDVFCKVEEELLELKEAIANDSQDNIIEELGDLLFSISQFARHSKFKAEDSLHAANQKFLQRFQAMEKLCLERNLEWSQLSVEAKEALWKEVKSHEKT